MNLREVSKTYPPRILFQGLSFSVFPGDRFFILGPSGCGKTTLLRIIAGLDRDHEGFIEINGQKVTGQGVFIPPHKRNVGFVFQDGALWPHLTVEKHLSFAPGSGNRKEWHGYLLDLTGLKDRGKDFPASLSGGERQRLSLARALSNQPALLLLDEPLRHLDRILAAELREAMVDILEKTDTTSIFVTHDQEEALSMAHRMLLFNREGPLQMGTPKEIYGDPRTPWAASFFGSINRFQAICDSKGCVKTPLGTFETGHSPGAMCELIFRASQVETGVDEGGIPAQVKRAVFHGETSLLTCEVEGQQVMACSRQERFEKDTKVYLRVSGKPMVFVL